MKGYGLHVKNVEESQGKFKRRKRTMLGEESQKSLPVLNQHVVLTGGRAAGGFWDWLYYKETGYIGELTKGVVSAFMNAFIYFRKNLSKSLHIKGLHWE